MILVGAVEAAMLLPRLDEKHRGFHRSH